METIKIADKDFIKCMFIEDNIEISIKYPKQSTLVKRFKAIDKLKQILRQI